MQMDSRTKAQKRLFEKNNYPFSTGTCRDAVLFGSTQKLAHTIQPPRQLEPRQPSSKRQRMSALVGKVGIARNDRS
jgi:hypothetical protein